MIKAHRTRLEDRSFSLDRWTAAGICIAFGILFGVFITAAVALVISLDRALFAEAAR